MSQISKADFARSHGFSKAYVSKLLKEGIISETKNGQIDEEGANQILSLRSSLNYGAHYKGDAKAIQEQLLTVRLENEIEKGKLLKLETAEKEQTLIPAEQVKETLFRKGRVIRDAMLNIPDRLSSLLATMDDARDIHQVLTQEIRAVLEELSEER